MFSPHHLHLGTFVGERLSRAIPPEPQRSVAWMLAALGVIAAFIAVTAVILGALS